MNIFFINYDGYAGCSGVHIHFLANALADRGHHCFVILPAENNVGDYFGEPRYSFLKVEEAIRLADHGSPLFRDAVIHAWTPREIVRQLTEYLSGVTGRPYLVHLEDNEDYILESLYKAPIEALRQAAAADRFDAFPIFSHPLFYPRFLANAAGVTCIVEPLKRFVPEGVPSQVFWPACEEAFFRLPLTPTMEVRELLGISPVETVITYPGSFHFANAHIMQELYLALEVLAENGHPVRLIRTGGEYDGISADAVKARERHVVLVRLEAASQLPPLVGAADILVQPGMPGPFDDCRFPSKLPFFLASGRPVITSPTNLGQYLKHEENCLLLADSSPGDIARQVTRLMDNPALARTVGRHGREFAHKYLSWDKSAAAVEAFYLRTLFTGNRA